MARAAEEAAEVSFLHEPIQGVGFIDYNREVHSSLNVVLYDQLRTES
jgi:hypothetical protein